MGAPEVAVHDQATPPAAEPGSKGAEEPTPGEEGGKSFTQADVDRIVQGRLKEEGEKHDTAIADLREELTTPAPTEEEPVPSEDKPTPDDGVHF